MSHAVTMKPSKCALSQVAERIGDPPGTRCSRKAAEGSRFCTECTARIVEKLVAMTPARARGYRKYFDVFFTALVGTLGAAVVTHFKTIIALAEHLAAGQIRFAMKEGYAGPYPMALSFGTRHDAPYRLARRIDLRKDVDTQLKAIGRDVARRMKGRKSIGRQDPVR